MPGQHVLVVGAGHGAVQLAVSLRQEGHAGRITLIGAEPGLPYQRPPLSKSFLKDGSAEKLNLRPESYFEKNAIELLNNTRVEKINRTDRTVSAQGKVYPYDHLVLATGTRNRRPPIAGLSTALELRTLQDAQQLRCALQAPCLHLAIIGGGFIGLEVAAMARAQGHDVSVIEASPQLMSRAVSTSISQHFRSIHEESGIRILTDTQVNSIKGSQLTFANGDQLCADLVLLAAGVQANSELAESAGLPVDNGIVVNAQLLTADPAVSSFGDCAAFPDPRTAKLIRLECIQAATEHSRTIARRLVHGSTDAYQALPWFWSEQGQAKLQIAGLATPEHRSVTANDGSVFRFDGEALTAVETVNNPKLHMRARRVLNSVQTITHAMLSAKQFDLFDDEFCGTNEGANVSRK